jgi:hypothetical protein
LPILASNHNPPVSASHVATKGVSNRGAASIVTQRIGRALHLLGHRAIHCGWVCECEVVVWEGEQGSPVWQVLKALRTSNLRETW